MLAMESIESVAQLIVSLGNNAAVARAIGKEPSTVSEMKRRGNVPVEYWPALLEAARAKCLVLTYDILVQMHLKRSSRSGSDVMSAPAGAAEHTVPCPHLAVTETQSGAVS